MKAKLQLDSQELEVEIIGMSGSTMYVVLNVKDWDAKDIVWLMHLVGNGAIASIEGRPVRLCSALSIDSMRIELGLEFIQWVSSYKPHEGEENESVD